MVDERDFWVKITVTAASEGRCLSLGSLSLEILSTIAWEPNFDTCVTNHSYFDLEQKSVI